MKYVALAGLSILLVACQGNTQDKSTTMTTKQDSVSYSIGLDIGKNLKHQSVEVNPDMLAQAIRDIQSGAEPKLTDEQVRACLTAFQEEMVAKQNEKMKVAATGSPPASTGSSPPDLDPLPGVY